MENGHEADWIMKFIDVSQRRWCAMNNLLFFLFFFYFFPISLSLSFLFYLFVAARTGSQLVKLPHSKLDEFSLAFPALTSSCSALSSPHLLFLSKAKVYKTFLHSTPESYGSLHANKMMGIKKLSTITQSVNFNDVQT